MELTNTERRNQKLTRDGYMYVFKKMLANDFSSLECILLRKCAQCKAWIKLSLLDELIGQNNEHIHPRSQTQVEVTKAKASIKRNAEASKEKNQQILASELKDISERAAATLPFLDALKRNIRHARAERNMLPIPRLVRKSQCFLKNIS